MGDTKNVALVNSNKISSCKDPGWQPKRGYSVAFDSKEDAVKQTCFEFGSNYSNRGPR